MPAIPNPYLNRIEVPTPPPVVTPYYERALYRRSIIALRWVVSLLALMLIGTALYPGGDTRPLQIEEPVPMGHSTWYVSDSAE